MNWQDMIKFNKEHLGKFVNNKEFWKRFNELEDLFEVIDDDLGDYEDILYKCEKCGKEKIKTIDKHFYHEWEKIK